MCERKNPAAALLWQKVRLMVRAETAKSSLEADVNQAMIKHNRDITFVHKNHIVHLKNDRPTGMRKKGRLKDESDALQCVRYPE
jgi:hypothetical protein